MSKRLKSTIPAFAAAALIAVVVGCGGSDSNDGAAAGVEQADEWVTTTPEATGELDSVKWALPFGEPSTLDYLQAAAYSENQVLASLCEGLLRTKPDLDTEPSLAEDVEHPDDTTYIYNLRDGVEFTDGTKMTADDAVFSLKRNLDPDSGTFWADWFVNVKSIRATDDLTVEVKLTQPDETFNRFMATAAGTVVQKKYVQDQGSKFGSAQGGVMCTGPFELTDWTPGESITIERNDNYWDSDNLAKTQKIEFEFLTDRSALNSALESGEIDGTYDAPISVDSSSAGTLYDGQSSQYVANTFTPRPGPIQDVRIREALNLSVNRADVAQAVFKDSAIGFVYYFVPATWSYERDEFEQQAEEFPSPDTADTEKAEKLVNEYVKDKGEVRELEALVDADNPSLKQLMTDFESQAEKIGIPVKIITAPANQVFAVAFDPERKKEYDILPGFGYTDIADPLVQAIWQLTPDGAFNDFGYDNPKVTKMIDEARQTSDDAKRADLLTQVADIAYKRDVVSMMVAVNAERLFLGNRVTGPPASLPSFLYYPWSRDLGAAEGG